MKLLRCQKCQDVFVLKVDRWLNCECNRSGGQYQEDQDSAVVAGPVEVYGLDNNLFWPERFQRHELGRAFKYPMENGKVKVLVKNPLSVKMIPSEMRVASPGLCSYFRRWPPLDRRQWARQSIGTFIDVRDLILTQSTVDMKRVLKFIVGWDAARLAYVAEFRGNYYVVDGHHRAVAAWFLDCALGARVYQGKEV